MTYRSIAISSGHSTKCQGAVGYLNEVAEATRVSDRLVEELHKRGVTVPPAFHDLKSTTQDQNLSTIIAWHNGLVPHDLDISVHFNASDGQGHGCEVWWQTQMELASKLSAAIATAGFTDRGEKEDEEGLYFLTNTKAPAVLLEICFVDNKADASLYQKQATFDQLCSAMADVLGGPIGAVKPPEIEEPEPPETETIFLFQTRGMCSWFGGPDDLTGVADDEDLAFIYDVQDAPYLFLPEDTPGTEGMGLARKLNSIAVNYVACRWPYTGSTKAAWRMALLENMALVRNVATGRETLAFPADWGPHEEQTGRAADLSQALMRDLQLATDDIVEVIFPAPDPF